MSISAMKQALEALDIIKASCSEGRVAHAENEAAIAEYILRQAIAEAEKQEPVLFFIQYKHRHEILWSKPKWVQDGVLEIKPFYAAPVYASDISQERVDETAKREREWVGLEEEEILKCFDSVALGQVEGDCVIDKHVNIFNAIRAIEAKLREKNCATAPISE